jgi:RNA methyltransferase, TrmH family
MPEARVAPSTGRLVAHFLESRRDPRRTVVEGFHALKHALRFGASLDVVVGTEPEELEQLAGTLAPDLVGRFRELVTIVDEQTFSRLAPRMPRTGVIAVAARPSLERRRERFDADERPAVLLEDPRNLFNVGACVRVAAACDVAGVVTTGPVDPWQPDALRGSAGLHFALPVLHAEQEEWGDRPLLALDPDGDPFDPAALPPRALLAFGTERYGLTDELRDQADARVALPMQAGVSSLNLATSVAAVLYAWRLSRPG